jgi:hypothetical protein
LQGNGSGQKMDARRIACRLEHLRKAAVGQFDQRNPVIQDIAEKMGRTPSSVSMKLCNLASLDPALEARGRKGLQGASNLDRAVWHEFQSNQNSMAADSERAIRNLLEAKESDDVDLVKGVGVRVERRRTSNLPLI